MKERFFCKCICAWTVLLIAINGQALGDRLHDALKGKWDTQRSAVTTLQAEFLAFSRRPSQEVSEQRTRQLWKQLDLRNEQHLDQFARAIDDTLPDDQDGYTRIKLAMSGDNYREDPAHDGMTRSIIRRNQTVVRLRPENNQANIYRDADFGISLRSVRDLRYLPRTVESWGEFTIQKINDDRVNVVSPDGSTRIVADPDTGFVYESVRIRKNRAVLRLQEHPMDGTDPVYFPAVSGTFTFVDDKLTTCQLYVIKTVELNQEIARSTFASGVGAGVRVVDMRGGIDNPAFGRTERKVSDLVSAVDKGQVRMHRRAKAL